MLCLGGGGWGFPFECSPRCPAQLGGSRVTICLSRLRPAGVRFALLLQALPFCCGLRPAATGYALRWSLSVVAGCLGNGWLRQQWACTSVGAVCLGNGGRPSPTELRPHGTPPCGAFGIAVLLVPLRHPKGCHPGISWAGSLSKSHSVSSSALPSLRLPAQQGTWTSALCADHCVVPPQCGPPLHQPLAAPAKTSAWRPVSPLYLGISPFCGQQRSVWKCGPDSPPPRIDCELQSWVVLTAPSSPTPAGIFFLQLSLFVELLVPVY